MKTGSMKNFLAAAAATLLLVGLPLQVQARQVQLNLGLGQEVLEAGQPQRVFIKIGLEGLAGKERGERAPINVALVLDRSGSMQGAKLENAKQAAILALDYLNRDDILSLVTYDHIVNVPVPATKLRDRQGVEEIIRGISSGGNTALFAGVSKGAAELKKFLDRNRVNRIVLLSDGLANVGPSTPQELGSLGRDLGGQGVTVTTIGLGLGYNEDLMARLAAASDGNHVFVEEPAQLASVFRSEFGELGAVVAQGITITIHCGDGVRPLRVLGRDARIFDSRVELTINQVFAEQEKYLMLEVETSPGKAESEREVARVEVSYDDLAARSRDRIEGRALVRYSASKEVVEQSLNKEVMVSATAQIGAQMDDRALELKDKGDAEGAQAVFREKAQYLEKEAGRYDSDLLRDQSQTATKAEAAAAAPAASDEWSKTRKAVREEQNIIQQQRSY
jgi:Ca-activated chloride channel homolog